MEEEKAAALYDDLSRKGEGAARFKQGLGFSSSSNSSNNREAVPNPPRRGCSGPPPSSSSSSFLTTFVKASTSPSKSVDKRGQLESIQNKLKKRPHHHNPIASTITRDGDRDGSHSSRRNPRRRSPSPIRNRDRRSRRRSRSRSRESRPRRRSSSPSRRKSPPVKKKSTSTTRKVVEKERKYHDDASGVDYERILGGHDKMTPAERVKAKMKFQLSEAAEKDDIKGTGSGWERFDFNKDAPLDDEEIEAVEDDAALVKHIGQSFRFATVEARRDEEIKTAHDEAMFGAPLHPPDPEIPVQEEAEIIKNETSESTHITNLLSDQVLGVQQGSWRHCIRKL